MSAVYRRVARIQFRKYFWHCNSEIHTTQALSENLEEDTLTVEDANIEKYLQHLRHEFYNLKTMSNLKEQDFRRIRQLSELVSAYEQRNSVVENISSLKDMDNEKDPDMKDLIKEEKEVYQSILANLDNKIIKQLLSLDNYIQYSSLYFEITAGVGGKEAMLFASDLLDMYTRFFDFKGWDYELVHFDKTELRGLRHATILIKDESAYSFLRYEGGVHRVQRVPATEKSGRIHTSTVTVAVIPCPDDIDSVINEKDLKIETKRASGAGGQHVNTTDSAVRIVHIPTGTVMECQTERSQVKNKEIALKKLETKLLEQRIQIQEETKLATRKAQVGASNRNEKIRTYNFIQDRITDHRLKSGTFHNMDEFLQGRETLDSLINQLALADRKTSLFQEISSLEIEKP